MKRSTAIVAVVMTLAIAGAIAWAGIDADRTEQQLQQTEAREGEVQPGEVIAHDEVEPDPPMAPPAIADDPERVRVAVEQARAAAPEDIARRLQEIDAEPRDEAWASAQETALRTWADSAASDVVGRLADIRCRTSGCVAEVVWPTYADAQREGRAFLAGSYGDACAREMRTPMPQDPRVAYAGLIVVTCNRE